MAPAGSEAWNTGWRMLYSLNRPDDVAEEVMDTTVGTRLLCRLFQVSETALKEASKSIEDDAIAATEVVGVSTQGGAATGSGAPVTTQPHCPAQAGMPAQGFQVSLDADTDVEEALVASTRKHRAAGSEEHKANGSKAAKAGMTTQQWTETLVRDSMLGGFFRQNCLQQTLVHGDNKESKIFIEFLKQTYNEITSRCGATYSMKLSSWTNWVDRPLQAPRPFGVALCMTTFKRNHQIRRVTGQALKRGAVKKRCCYPFFLR